jgi:hypothetical protein
LLVVFAVFALLLFSPVVLVVDSRSRDARLRWSFLISGAFPLPGAKRSPQLRVAGVRIAVPPRKKKDVPGAKRSEQRRQRRRESSRLFWNCLLDGDIRSALLRRFRRLPADLWGGVEVSRWESNVSLPDPALNGILWGALAAMNNGPRMRLHCNFTGKNEVRTEVRLYPHRVVKALLSFVLRLPYLAVYRRWRAAQAHPSS